MSRHRHAPTFATFADSTLAARLRTQVRFAVREARRDPRGFVRSLVASDPLDRRSRRELWSIRLGIPAASSSGFALGVLVYATLFGAPQEAIAQTEENPVPPVLVAVAPPREPGPPMPRDPGTLGGGGSGDPWPVSKGARPPSSLAVPVVPPTTKPVPPQLDPLRVPPPLQGDPVPTPPDLYGDPTSTTLDPSDGSGRNDGTGIGRDAGWGPERGPTGGRGPNGTGSDGPSGDVEPRPATKAVILSTPRPTYTELARANRAEGAVKVRVMLGADGRVHRAAVVHGLGFGLDERAIEAVNEIRFRPATDAAGKPVDSWITVRVSFTIR